MASINVKKCDTCSEELPETCFRRYQNKKHGDFRRLATCNSCRQKNPKRPDLILKKTSAKIRM